MLLVWLIFYGKVQCSFLPFHSWVVGGREGVGGRKWSKVVGGNSNRCYKRGARSNHRKATVAVVGAWVPPIKIKATVADRVKKPIQGPCRVKI